MDNKIVLIGCGNVGMSYAYALLNQRTPVRELVLIDINEERIIGEAKDLSHGLPFAPSKINIHVGTYADCHNAKMVVIAAGSNQEVGETRMDLINKNSKIFSSITASVMASGFTGIFLVATNPLDVMTYLTWKYSGLPTSHIIGSGTSLDTARLRYLIAEKVEVNAKNIHAYVMGEHGDTEFIPWSLARIGLEKVTKYLSEEELNQITHDVKDAAYDIIKRKGSTCYGIGMCLVRITNAILGNENSILAVSSYDDKNDVFVGGPAIVNQDGIKERIYINLTPLEQEQMQNSIDTIKKAINSLN
ncbi:MAG: L-lactate dehydrogenase [Bacilli bacterium]